MMVASALSVPVVVHAAHVAHRHPPASLLAAAKVAPPVVLHPLHPVLHPVVVHPVVQGPETNHEGPRNKGTI